VSQTEHIISEEMKQKLRILNINDKIFGWREHVKRLQTCVITTTRYNDPEDDDFKLRRRENPTSRTKNYAKQRTGRKNRWTPEKQRV